MKIRLAVAFGFLAWLGLAAVAEARVVRYHSQHPLPGKGAGFCYIDVPHVHAFAPAEPRVYRVHDDEYYFVGDPTPYGYEGDHYAFYGPHPVAEVEFGEPVYCYIEGPHYHWYQPTPAVSVNFEMRGGAYWYVGTYDPVFYSARPRFVVINEVYRPMVYARPVVDITVRPPAFRGTIVATPPMVGAGVVVGGPARGVTVAQPPGVMVAPHDNGRHEGWYKEHGNPHGGPVGGPVGRPVTVGQPPGRGGMVAQPPHGHGGPAIAQPPGRPVTVGGPPHGGGAVAMPPRGGGAVAQPPHGGGAVAQPPHGGAPSRGATVAQPPHKR